MTATKIRSRKSKGRRLQNYVAERIREVFQLSPNDVKPAVMGESGMDIKLSNHARDSFPFAVECKNTEKANLWSWIAQSEENAKGLTPIVVFKRNHSKTYVIIEFDSFINGLKNFEEEKKDEKI